VSHAKKDVNYAKINTVVKDALRTFSLKTKIVLTVAVQDIPILTENAKNVPFQDVMFVMREH